MHNDAIIAQSRSAVRHETRFPTAIQVHPDHADQFRLSFPDAQTDLAVVDVSKGGLGLISGVLIPKNLRISLTINDIPGADGEPRSLTIRGIVRRVSMIDHKPNYMVGVQFLDASGIDELALIKAVAGKEAEKKKQPVLVGGANGA